MAVAGTLTYKTELDTDGIKKSGSTVKSIIAGLGITKMITKAVSTITSSIDDAITRLDTINNFPKVMSNLGISAQEADKSIKKMSDKLAGLPTTLDQGAMAVQRFTSKNGDVAKSTDIFLALNNAILAGGASTELQATALEQMSQAYAKGKPDMMEWRSIMSAMPAQLNQVADAMGLGKNGADQLGEALRDGSISMDDFMDTIIDLNKNGSKSFQSFEKQAKNSTNGMRTAITVAKTQIVKGVASIIDSIDKNLKKSNTSISKIIANIGNKLKKALESIGNLLSKLPLKSILDILGKMLPIIINVTAAWVAYHAVLKAITILTVAKKIGETAIAFVQLIPSIKSAKDAMDLLMMTFNANPIVLVVTAVAALTTALIAFSSESDNTNKKLEELKKKSKEYDDTMKEINKRKDESLSASMHEIYGYQSLYDELKTIVDENGKVKEGYEERAKIITGELSKALGIEIGLVDGVIQNYKDLQQEISNLIEKKKAEAYFNAHQEEYQKALKDEAGLYKDVADAASKRKNSLDKMTAALDKEIKNNKELGKYKEDIIKYLKDEVSWSDLSFKAREAYNTLISDETLELFEKESDAYYKHNEELKTASELYAKNEAVIKKNREASEALTKADQALKEGKKETADEYFKQVARIYNDTVTFNAETEKVNNDSYEKEKTNRQAYLDFLKQNQDKYSEDFIKSEEERIKKELEQLEKEKNDANEVIKQKNKETLDTTRTGLNDQLKALTDKKYEFRDAGNGNVQLYIDGVESGKPMSLKKANELTSGVVNQLNSGKIGAEEAGWYLSNGFAVGINKGVGNAVAKAAYLAQAAIDEVKRKAQIQSPSKVTKQLGKYFDEGFEIGIKDGEKDVIKTAGDFSDNVIDEISEKMNIDKVLDDMYKEMNKTIQMENAKLNFDVASNDVYNKSLQLPAIIDLSANFEGTVPVQLNLDGEKIYDNQQKISIRKSVQYGGMK